MSQATFQMHLVGAHADRSGKTRTFQIIGSNQDDEHKAIDGALANLTFQAGVTDGRFDEFADGDLIKVTIEKVGRVGETAQQS